MSYETDDKMVSHPNHYNSGKFEVIDIIEEFTKDLSGIEAVDTANAIKYVLRWHKKNGVQDVNKAIWYLTHLKEHLEDAPKSIDKCKSITFDKDGYANRIDLPWLRMDKYPPQDGEWGFFTDGTLEGVGRWKHDAMDHLYPFYGPESFDHCNITHWCPLGNLPKKEE